MRKLLLTLAALLALSAAPSLANGPNFGPSINHNGLWIPNPVAQVEHEIQNLKYRLSLRHLKDKIKYEAYQHVPLARKAHDIYHVVRY